MDHAPDLSVFLIKILYLQAQGKKVEALSKQSGISREKGRGHHIHAHAQHHMLKILSLY